jgi:hypothetical protein
VIETIARFDTVDLLTAVAALQVMPVNISRTVRLEVLAHAIATQAVDTKGAKPSLDDLRRLCNNKPLASFEITRSEDPPEFLVSFQRAATHPNRLLHQGRIDGDWRWVLR